MNNGYFNSVFDEQTTAQKSPQMLSATGMESFLATVDRVGYLPGSLYDWCKLQVAKDPEEVAKLMYESKKREISTEQTLGLRTSGQIIMSIPQGIAVTILDPFVLAGVIVLVSCRRRLSLWWHFLLYLIIGWILFKVFQILPKW
jgi:hypothetical protein